ncbi:hypothetical protein K431DRAFT_28545 [Polychaeton citri CBS 116435]|uniref:ferric-chelate reductase (NADPH) n=1 Tax=Polychaeton citri CBS 116435 TaxID=1314669 RepID=A0A9P4QEF6_9PEZI|nr:hypothetical protein K431DRAFT_28545 [Polychaeton citri CBS 116435]
MDGMDMGDMSGGMDMGSAGMFTPVNKSYARGYWYAIAGSTALLCLVRSFDIFSARHRYAVSRRQRNTITIPSRPQTAIGQTYATITAVFREIGYSQPICFTGRWLKHFTPLPTGHWLLLLVYWAFLLGMLWTNVILKEGDDMYGYRWEKPAFRAGWISAAQIPFIYLLSGKFNLISLLTGISYERLNWLHRWAARTVFLTVIVHWAYFFHEWKLADFVKLELQMMPMVKYGFGAWAVLGWMVLSGFGFVRSKCYEVFVAQHIAAAGVLLWLLYVHLPSYARYHVWMSVAFVLSDWTVRIIWNIFRNMQLRKGNGLGIGFDAELEQLPGGMVRVVLDNTDFTWRAGQHVYLSIPRLRPLELHPFTIANASKTCSQDTIQRNDSSRQPSPGSARLEMVIKAHSGFSRSLYKASGQSTPRRFRALISGPWGNPPNLTHYDTVVLVACASGASFTVPLLQDLATAKGCVRRVVFHWILRHEEHIAWFERSIQQVIKFPAAGNGVIPLRVDIVIHLTEPSGNTLDTSTGYDKLAESLVSARSVDSGFANSSNASTDENVDEKTALHGQSDISTSNSAFNVHHTGGRPTMDSLIRPAVEAAYGETAVVVCGGQEISAQARTYVAGLSDERAVHKGTGAQGIFLFCESYGW